jgi:hypothetical protein
LDYRQELDSADGAQGLPRRRPGAVIFFKRYVAGDIYPAHLNVSVNQLSADGELPPGIEAKPLPPRIEVAVRPELRGFAYCDDTVFKIEEVPGGFYAVPQNLGKINGEAISEELLPWIRGSDLVFERDASVILPRRYQIGTIFGAL